MTRSAVDIIARQHAGGFSRCTPHNFEMSGAMGANMRENPDAHKPSRRGVIPRSFVQSFVAAAAVSLWLVPSNGFAQCPTQDYNVPTREFDIIQPRPGTTLSLANPLTAGAPPSTLTVVALGDSVVWGNGLKNPNKFIELAGQQIADRTQRSVQIVSFAHSGARLFLHPDSSDPPSPKNGYAPLIPTDNHVPPGDLNSAYPTTYEQADCAAAVYPGAEIVVMDGCINEAGASDIALPPIVNHTTKQQIEQRVYDFCAAPMAKTLFKVKAAFPKATIIVLNYYQIVSSDSSVFRALSEAPPPGMRDDGSQEQELRRMAKEQLKIEKMLGMKPQAEKINRSEMRHWPDNSIAFLNTSQGCFEWAIASPSETLDPSSAPDPACPPHGPLPAPSPDAVRRDERVYLATVPNRPDFAYGAPHKHIWSLPIQILFFFTIHADDMYRVRKRMCWSHYKGLDQAAAREVCTINPIAHPNREGAKAYACSIVLGAHLKCDPNQPGILDLAWAQP
jgi:hypothetical protein